MLGTYQHWIVDAWRANEFDPAELEQAIADADAFADRGYGRTSASDPDLLEIANAWRETAILRLALGERLDPWLYRAHDISAHDERYRSGGPYNPVTIWGTLLPLPDYADRVVCEKCPYVGGGEIALLAANATALEEDYPDRAEIWRRYAYGGSAMAMDLRADESDGSYDTARAILDTIEGLDGYPVVCEQALFDLEMERMSKHIDEWLLADLWRAVVNGSWKERETDWRVELPPGFCELAEDLIESEPDWLVEFAREALWAQYGYYSVDDMPLDDRTVQFVRRAIVFYLTHDRAPAVESARGYRCECVSDLPDAVFS